MCKQAELSGLDEYYKRVKAHMKVGEAIVGRGGKEEGMEDEL